MVGERTASAAHGERHLVRCDRMADCHLAAHDATKAQVVKLRFFAGLTNEQVARVLGVSEPTVKRHWAYARAWLFREMNS